MSFRRAMAAWLCPDFELESDRLFRIRADMSEKIRWLGHDYPMVEVVLARIMIDDMNCARQIHETPRLQEYPNLGGVWPPDIHSFREKMRSTFGVFPTPRPNVGVGTAP